MTKFLILSLSVILIAKTGFPQHDTIISSPVMCESGNWVLTYADEFEGDVLNVQDWVTWYPYSEDGSDRCAFCRTHGREGQIFLDENVEVSDGLMRIIAKQDSVEWMGEHRDYTSGMIHSRTAFGHGRYEVRSKLPPGAGFWPAIWTFGQISAELDIMEAGMQNPKRYHTSIHNWQVGIMAHNKNRVRRNLAEDFHVYTMEWEPNIIRFFIDEKEVWSLSRFTSRRGRNLKTCDLKPGRYKINPVFPSELERLYLIIGLGIGNESTPFTKSPDGETIFPNQMEVDWIRIYQRE
ncbi:MAG: glycoside hydrolase family 16 protein [Lentimicrobium sp.]|nr:glycoside hydrolase family 16 protein [Lentimicrobium sp.]